MTITYLIGNGLDVGLKLKTDYKSFIDWYLAKQDIPSEMNWVRREMQEQPNRWSDAEIAFGQLKFAEQGKNPLQVFNRSYDSFTDAFDEYLLERNKHFEIPKVDRRKTAEEFIKRVVCLHEWMSPQCRQLYLDQMNSQQISVHFLTFNYTDTLEQILDFHEGQPNEFSIQMPNNQTLKVLVKSVHHVHGTLDDAYVFGVDMPDQICDSDVRRYCERNGGMLKAKADEKLGLLNRNRGMEILRKSNRIVTYGLSFGMSDTSWWKLLYDRVFSRGTGLVVCPFRDDLPERLSAKKRADVYMEEKKKVFHSLIVSNQKLEVQLEEASPPTIISLRPCKVPDGLGKMHWCDYFRLSTLAWHYTKKQSGIKTNP